MYNLVIAGQAGDGIETMSSVLESVLKHQGYHVFTVRDYMSRVRGGHNFVQLRFGHKPIRSHQDAIDGLILFGEEFYGFHQPNLKEDSFILGDRSFAITDDRFIPADLKEIAKNAGNPMTISSAIIGYLSKMLSLNLPSVKEMMKKFYSAKIIEANIIALDNGYEQGNTRTTMESRDLSQHILITGATAMSLGALAADMKFYSAYPMSPSTTLLSYFQSVEKEFEIVTEQAEDEIAAAMMAIGASAAGARSMTGTSGGGFSLMVESLGFAGIAEIPIVMVDVQRPGPATGLPTRTEQSDLKFMVSASQGEFPRMVIAIQSPVHAYTQTARAFHLAEKYQIPVLLLSDQFLADTTTTVPLDSFQSMTNNASSYNNPVNIPDGETYKRYQVTDSGVSPLLFPGQTKHLVRVDSDEHTEDGVITESAAVRTTMVDKRQRKLELLKEDLIEPILMGDKDGDILLVAFGSTCSALEEAVEILNKRNSTHYVALSFGDVFPLPTKLLYEYGRKAKAIISVEQNATGQLASLIRESTLLPCKQSLLKYDGRQLSTADIVDGLMDMEQRGVFNEQ